MIFQGFITDEIVSIEGNTNIFIYSENMPIFSHNVITLRPRTHANNFMCIMSGRNGY